MLPRSRACVGAEVLLGCDRPAVDLIASAESTALSLDLEKELKHFYFDERAALVTRSQIEEKDLTLPSRFVQVRIWSLMYLYPACMRLNPFAHSYLPWP